MTGLKYRDSLAAKLYNFIESVIYNRLIFIPIHLLGQYLKEPIDFWEKIKSYFETAPPAAYPIGAMHASVLAGHGPDTDPLCV